MNSAGKIEEPGSAIRTGMLTLIFSSNDPYYYHYGDNDDGDDDNDDDDEYTNTFSASRFFYSYTPHFPSSVSLPSTMLTIPLF